MIEFLRHAFNPKDYKSSRNAGQLAANELKTDVGLVVPSTSLSAPGSKWGVQVNPQ